MRTRLIIERKGSAIGWEEYAYPINIEEAKKIIDILKFNEQQKLYKGTFRLIRETREIIDT